MHKCIKDTTSVIKYQFCSYSLKKHGIINKSNVNQPDVNYYMHFSPNACNFVIGLLLSVYIII